MTRAPVGFERFHRRAFVNYQLNRAHALGYADRDELRDAAAKIRSGKDCVAVFESLSATAERDGRDLRADFGNVMRGAAAIAILYRRPSALG